jgi:rare lipoprotein A
MSPLHSYRALAAAWIVGLLVFTPPAPAAAPSPAQATPPARIASAPAKQDLTGRKRVGKASFYAKQFSGRKMADGRPMDPHRDNAASRTLPLGTKAKVTNLETGQSAVVTIQDRGPYVPGRIVDLSPSTAQQVGITPKKGVATVEVAPIAVPLPDGSVKPGAAASASEADAR